MTTTKRIPALGDDVVIEKPEDEMGEDRFYLSALHFQECDLAERLRYLANSPVAKRDWLSEEVLQSGFERNMGYRMTDEQIDVVYSVLNSPLSVITGGPGTGKTSITRAIVSLCKTENIRVGLASPTGRAARRLAEACAHEASTMHRLLQWLPDEGFFYNAENPLPYDLCIVDEVSMVDLQLARAFFAAIDRSKTQVVLVGDKDQLSSVGCGSVLHHIIQSGVCPVHYLTKIMRQAANSGIVVDAHRINRGEMPSLDWGDCTFIEHDDPEMIQKFAVSILKSSDGEAQILAPMRKGIIGINELNVVAQKALNPPHPGKPELAIGGEKFRRVYRLGDRVICTRNDYSREVVNGEIGEVIAVDVKERLVTIRYEEVETTYSGKELDDVELAYALSVHRSQGSEYENVIICLHSGQHFLMCQRGIFYTGLTRAKKKVTVIGDKKAIQMCVNNNKSQHRNSALLERLTA